MKLQLAILSIFLIGCASVRTVQTPALGQNELAIIKAAVAHELASSDVSTRRPVLLLDKTDNWMPAADEVEDLNNLPPDVREQIIEQIERRNIPQGLRSNNVKPYSLIGVEIPNPILLYGKSDFDRLFESNTAGDEFVHKFGKEPFVLSISRPFINENGEAVLLLHRLSTWSGCGGLDIVRLGQSEDAWIVKSSDLLIFW